VCACFFLGEGGGGEVVLGICLVNAMAFDGGVCGSPDGTSPVHA
jgi:hypothetical protein